MTTLMIDLPESLIKEAENAGLLAPDAIEAMLRERLRRRAIDGLFNAADRLEAANLPTMTMEEVQEEVNAVRALRRQRAPGA